ncbi:MAG: ATP-binding cassette domain-containing protein [Eubacteriales bacterium]|nr:ATP-binding cassette domain-containing protein [Eubacteriales bacterium]
MQMIQVDHLTKDYGFGRGVFDVSFGVEQGEVFGFLGPNGAGKTTTIRHIMGFSKPQEGMITVQGKESWKYSAPIQRQLGYLPGEIAFPVNMTGSQFIDHMANLRGLSDRRMTNYLLKKFELEPDGDLKRMSLGMKRKLAIVTAFMHDPEILVLDEPTSGLDPIMQERFIEFILEEKERGRTILLSSHIFSEVDATCDRIAIIKDGILVSTIVADTLRHNEDKVFKVEFDNEMEYQKFVCSTSLKLNAKRPGQNQVKVMIKDENIHQFFDEMSCYRLKFISEIKFTLEDYFMNFYDRKKSVEEGKEGMLYGLY